MWLDRFVAARVGQKKTFSKNDQKIKSQKIKLIKNPVKKKLPKNIIKWKMKKIFVGIAGGVFSGQSNLTWHFTWRSFLATWRHCATWQPGELFQPGNLAIRRNLAIWQPGNLANFPNLKNSSGLPGCRVARVAGMPGCGALPGCRVAGWLPGCRVAGLPG